MIHGPFAVPILHTFEGSFYFETLVIRSLNLETLPILAGIFRFFLVYNDCKKVDGRFRGFCRNF